MRLLALKRDQTKVEMTARLPQPRRHLHPAEMQNDASNIGPVLSGPEKAGKAGNAQLGLIIRQRGRHVELVVRVRPIF